MQEKINNRPSKNYIDSASVNTRFISTDTRITPCIAKQYCLIQTQILNEIGIPRTEATIYFNTGSMSCYKKIYYIPEEKNQFASDLFHDNVEVAYISYPQYTELRKYCILPGTESQKVENLVRYAFEKEPLPEIDRDSAHQAIYKWITGQDPSLSDTKLPLKFFSRGGVPLFQMVLHPDMYMQKGIIPGFYYDDTWFITSTLPRFFGKGKFFSMDTINKYIDGMKDLMTVYPSSTGYIHMDSFMACHGIIEEGIGISNKYVRYQPDKVPGCVWAMFLSKEQMLLLGNIDEIKKNVPVFACEQLPNGSGMLQLTPDINELSMEQLYALRKHLLPFTPHGKRNILFLDLITTHLRVPIHENELEINLPKPPCQIPSVTISM